MVNYLETSSYLLDNHQLTKFRDHHSPIPDLYYFVYNVFLLAYVIVKYGVCSSPKGMKSAEGKLG
jgi:hypothetical protein